MVCNARRRRAWTRKRFYTTLFGYKAEHDLAVDQWHFLPYLSLVVDDVPTTRINRLAILNLEDHDQKHTKKTRQKLSVHFDFFSS